MIDRRSFLAATLGAALTPASLQAAAPVDLKAFGAVGDGIADDGPAFSRALEAAARLATPLRIPAGRYVIARPPGGLERGRATLRNGSIEIVGEGSGLVTLIAPPLHSRAADVAPISQSILSVLAPSRLHVRGVTLDGGVGSADKRSTAGFGPTDAAALIEVVGCGDVLFEDVVTTRNRHARFNDDPEGRTFGRSGPVFALDCSNVRLIDCGSMFPCFTEGWWLLDCRKVTVERFRHRGPARFNPAATTTPLNIFGPKTEDVTIRGCDIRNALGSSLNLGGKGRFRVTGNRFEGTIVEGDAVFGREAGRPHDGAYGKGLDLSAEHQESYFPGHPPMRDVVIAENVFQNLFSYSVAIDKTGDCPLDGLTFRGNQIVHGFRGLSLRSVRNASVAANRFERIVRYEGASRRAFGVTMSADQCSALDVTDNVFDGAVRPRPGPGLGEGIPEIGLFVTRSDDVSVRGNRFLGFDSYQMLADVAVGDDRRYGGFQIVGNAFEGAPGSRPTAFRLGRGEDRRLARAEARDNRFDQATAGTAEIYAD